MLFFDTLMLVMPLNWSISLCEISRYGISLDIVVLGDTTLKHAHWVDGIRRLMSTEREIFVPVKSTREQNRAPSSGFCCVSELKLFLYQVLLVQRVNFCENDERD